MAVKTWLMEQFVLQNCLAEQKIYNCEQLNPEKQLLQLSFLKYEKD
jgi:hypothetical protein